MKTNHVRPVKSYEWVMEEIKRQIETGRRVPGDKLPSVVALAEEFGVGRSTVREALSALKAMGWLEIRQGGGTFVKAVPPEDDRSRSLHEWFAQSESLKEILQVRKVLETGCASLASGQRNGECLRKLGHIVSEMESALGDEKKGADADARFHLQIARCTGNSMLIQMSEMISERLRETIRDSRNLWLFGERASAEQLLAEHRSIYEAILSGDGKQAALRMEQHLEKVEKVLSPA